MIFFGHFRGKGVFWTFKIFRIFDHFIAFKYLGHLRDLVVFWSFIYIFRGFLVILEILRVLGSV